jgi:hypothetical protein
VDSGPDGGAAAAPAREAPEAAAVQYASAAEALQAVKEEYHYWTGKLSETSLQFSYALIAANWSAFPSVDTILRNPWSKLSIALVVVGLGLNLIGTKAMGELHRAKLEYADADSTRWQAEFTSARGVSDAWPFTRTIEVLGRAMRELKIWMPLASGAAFIVALLVR